MLFEALVTSTVCYSLDSCPLTESLGRRLDVVQRRMLRRMVGWISHSDDTWEDRGRRMKLRLNAALESYPMHDWSQVVRDRKWKFLGQKPSWPALARQAAEWLPPDCTDVNKANPFRGRGRPATRWNDF